MKSYSNKNIRNRLHTCKKLYDSTTTVKKKTVHVVSTWNLKRRILPQREAIIHHMEK